MQTHGPEWLKIYVNGHSKTFISGHVMVYVIFVFEEFFKGMIEGPEENKYWMHN